LEVIFHPLPVFTYICIFIVTHFFAPSIKNPRSISTAGV